MRPPDGIAVFDSASTMAMGLARRLHGRDFPGLGKPRWLQYPAAFADLVPRQARETLFSVFGAREGVPPEAAGDIPADVVAAWFASLPPPGRRPVVIVGASSGALVHLASALGAPWLPQTFLALLRRSDVDPDDAEAAMAAGVEPGRRFLAANPGVQLHHMQDPNQDRLMLRRAAYFRVKFRRLPDAYRDYLRRALAPGGVLLVAEGRRRWPTTRVGERHVFQFGAVGGASEAEFHQGGPRIEEYLARHGAPRRRWTPPRPNGESPEAEWGYEPALTEDLADLAGERGARLLRLVFDAPDDLSPLIAALHRDWARERGLRGDMLLVDSFILQEPLLTLRLGAAPFWMVFNKRPSLEALSRHLDAAEPYRRLRLTLFAHGVDSIGLPSIEEWREVLARVPDGAFAGVDERGYPAHFSVYARHHLALAREAPRVDPPPPLPFERVEEFLRREGPAHGVRLEG